MLKMSDVDEACRKVNARWDDWTEATRASYRAYAMALIEAYNMGKQHDEPT